MGGRGGCSRSVGSRGRQDGGDSTGGRRNEREQGLGVALRNRAGEGKGRAEGGGSRCWDETRGGLVIPEFGL